MPYNYFLMYIIYSFLSIQTQLRRTHIVCLSRSIEKPEQNTIESESEMLRKTFQQNIEKTAIAFEKERQTYQELILKQQLTIDALLELVAKREK